MMSARRSTRRWSRRLAAGVGASLLLTVLPVQGGTAGAAAPPTAQTSGLLGTVGGLLGGVGTTLDGLLSNVLGAGFRLGLFDEFRGTGTAVWPGDVRNATKAAAPLSRGIDGSGVDVALVDTGTVPVPGLDAPGAVINGPDLSFDHQGGVPAGLDGFGHGTHLAGIIVGRGTAKTQGLAPAARLVNVKVGAGNGAVDVSQVIAAIDWVVQHRHDPGVNIRVLNLSYGTDGTQSYRSDPLAHAVESAWRNGVVVVVAAGNSGGALLDPAVDPYVLTVGSVDLGDPSLTLDDRVAPYSSVGTSARRVDLVVPGTSIVSLRDPGSTIDDEHPEARVGETGFRGSGTSQAAAVASGLVADLLEARPSLTPDEVKAVLRETARPVSGSALAAQGAGMVDLDAATKVALPSAKQAFVPSTGLGTIEGARGTSHVSLEGVELRGERDVQSGPWTPATWAPKASAGTAWTGGVWNGQVWAGDSWLTGGTDWSGRTWRDATWTGRTWRDDAWAGRTWRGDTWTGRTWRSS
ncbi:MAG: peptidase and in kexin sedolisin [Acidimicrobiales bacterium]|nr:peptidase and in kexin sedolisin [Acidimicrobiales bacterium]